ncbi:MAG TPA: GNAT family N-acetyltransferase [Microbacteriaceae bacterium]|nr:GNAT family N-acetyltransferase [Microbacteriaceae bacterium]
MAEHSFSDNPDARRYELHIDGELIGTADYAVSGDTVAITRVFTRPTHRGQGLAYLTTEYAVDRIVADGRKVVPVCWVAERWFGDHPERADARA